MVELKARMVASVAAINAADLNLEVSQGLKTLIEDFSYPRRAARYAPPLKPITAMGRAVEGAGLQHTQTPWALLLFHHGGALGASVVPSGHTIVQDVVTLNPTARQSRSAVSKVMVS